MSPPVRLPGNFWLIREQGKGMAIEIERKFLVKDDSWRDQADAGTPMRQAYLSRNPKNSIRVRIAGDRANLNIKSATPGCVRREYEYEIPLAEAEELFTLCLGSPVVKVRYRVPCGEFTFEIDVFSGANQGLVVAEIELDDLKRDFPKPPWLGPEVSDELRYYNSQLAVHPYEQWTPAEKNPTG